MRADLLRWLFSALIAQGGLIVALVKLPVLRGRWRSNAPFLPDDFEEM